MWYNQEQFCLGGHLAQQKIVPNRRLLLAPSGHSQGCFKHPTLSLSSLVLCCCSEVAELVPSEIKEVYLADNCYHAVLMLFEGLNLGPSWPRPPRLNHSTTKKRKGNQQRAEGARAACSVPTHSCQNLHTPGHQC